MTIRLLPDDQWFRSKNGNGVLAGSPLTYFGVTDAGSKILDAIETNSVLPQNHAQLTDRLLATGAVHPLPDSPSALTDITVVIPAFISNEESHVHLEKLVASLIGLTIIIVDDASPHPIDINGAHVLRHDTNKGPAAARNTGIAAVTTTAVACIDADVMVTSTQIATLAAYVVDSRVGAVAPRITCVNDGTFTGEFESHHSPLDLGCISALVRPMSRVSYLPATVLVFNVQSLRAVGGFDDSIRIGEDVDLIWRLIENGIDCRYVPSIECPHRPRSSMRKMLKQRYDYGTSAALLEKRHPRAASPLRAHALLLTMATTVLMGYLYSAIILVVPTMAYFVTSLRTTTIPTRTRLQLALKAIFSTTRLLARAIMRAWWPLFFLASFVSLRIGAMFTFSAFVPPLVGLMRNKPNHPIRYLVMRILEGLAYGTGVWVGAVRSRSLRCLLPVITVRRSVAR
jgi:mycofactocin system glycosyltransferase